jgi:23S rRNA pseudouridine2605 synthase
MESDSTRLNKLLALQLGVSRREADILIETGMVTVNGKVAELGSRAREADAIVVAGKPIASKKAAYIYLAFNKPVGYVCSRRPQGDSPTIYNIIPHEYHALKPVGRLDRNSSGLLLLTNDGDFAFKMTHPKFVKTKVYHVRIDHDLQPLHQQMISDFGVDLEDGRSQLTLARLNDDRRDEWEVTMSEGRNRQIRRTFAALGYTVKELHRIQFGNYTIGDMKPGELISVDMR